MVQLYDVLLSKQYVFRSVITSEHKFYGVLTAIQTDNNELKYLRKRFFGNITSLSQIGYPDFY